MSLPSLSRLGPPCQKVFVFSGGGGPAGGLQLKTPCGAFPPISLPGMVFDHWGYVFGVGPSKIPTPTVGPLGLGNTVRAEILEGAGDCDQKSVAGTLPGTDFWRGKLRPETRRRNIAGRRSHEHKGGRPKQNSNTYSRPSLGLGNTAGADML